MAKSFGYRDFPPDVLKALREQAAREDMTQKALLEKILRAYLEKGGE